MHAPWRRNILRSYQRIPFLLNNLKFQELTLKSYIFEAFCQYAHACSLCSKFYLLSGAWYEKNYFVKLLLKFNFKQILFYAKLIKNVSFIDFLRIFQILEFEVTPVASRYGWIPNNKILIFNGYAWKMFCSLINGL